MYEYRIENLKLVPGRLLYVMCLTHHREKVGKLWQWVARGPIWSVHAEIQFRIFH